MFFGIRPAFRQMGIDAVLFHEVITAGLRLGYTNVELSMMLEDNDPINRMAKALGVHIYKTWRIYDLDL